MRTSLAIRGKWVEGKAVAVIVRLGGKSRASEVTMEAVNMTPNSQ